MTLEGVDEGKKINQNTMMKMLDWAYDAAVNGIPGLGTAEDLGDDYLEDDDPLDKKINSLIRWQNTKCATSGFVTGLGGIITMPVALPANIASVLYVQIRMVAAIAYMCGYDIREDRVKTLVYVCLVGSAATDLLKDTGIKAGTKFANVFIQKNVTREMLTKINQAVGFRLVTKFGETGIINLGKVVPVVGGVIGATIDALSTNVIGKTAKKTFMPTSAKEEDNI